jgi:hypothetical protein
MSEWISRFQLGQSTTISGAILKPEHIYYIIDESELSLTYIHFVSII